ncbi:MAG: signal recognition particle-docking protein FtsY [Halobellus sp.]|uniref:signal recognition particle-docking protein FtsY n=1 Tax=Halobellus sp. TaxID=1979212 RepID=UPI0035D4A2A2
MFDGLKNKLNSFREDVEETAEEKDAAESDRDADDPASDAADGQTPTESDAAASSDAGDASGELGDAGQSNEAGSSAGAHPSEGDESGGDAAQATAGDGLAAEEAAAALEEETEDESGPSRLQRAAAFATGKIIIEEDDLADPLWNLEMALLESDVEMNVAEEILDTVREKMVGETRAQVQTTGELVESALHDALYDVISVGQFDFDERVAEADKPVTIVFTGVNGVGKTTSIAKMARYFEARDRSVVLANGDTYRAGANEQLQKHADNLDQRLISHEQGGDPAAVLYDAVEYAEANGVDVVLGDTAGRLHTSNDLMAQLEKIDRVVDPDMTLFVDEAVAGQDAVERAKQFNDAAEIDGAVLTKADADSNGGAAISIAYVTGKPILFLGTGQGYDDLERFDPERMVDRLVDADGS